MLSAIDKMDFIERYVGLLPDSSIALELHTDVEEIRKLKREFSQLCWSCKHACDETKCDWVRRCNGTQSDTRINNYPNYVETKIVTKVRRAYNSDTEYIVECKRYVGDARW